MGFGVSCNTLKYRNGLLAFIYNSQADSAEFNWLQRSSIDTIFKGISE